MFDPTTKLTVLHDAGGLFSDLSDDATDFIRDSFTFTLTSATDYLYIGYYKPFNTVYSHFDTAAVAAGTFTAEYYNGTAWTALSLEDQTKGFSRSGFIFWDKSNMAQISVDSKSAYYIRLKPTSDLTATVRGINLIFSDDNALKQEFFEIDNETLLPPGETSHLVHHVAARNTIVQMLRNQGYLKVTDGSSVEKQITQWDLMDIHQVRQSAVYLTLSKIFFLLSDSQEDTWWVKYKEYQMKFEDSFRLIRLTVDQDDDGQTDVAETNELFKVNRWQR